MEKETKTPENELEKQDNDKQAEIERLKKELEELRKAQSDKPKEKDYYNVTEIDSKFKEINKQIERVIKESVSQNRQDDRGTGKVEKEDEQDLLDLFIEE